MYEDKIAVFLGKNIYTELYFGGGKEDSRITFAGFFSILH